MLGIDVMQSHGDLDQTLTNYLDREEKAAKKEATLRELGLLADDKEISDFHSLSAGGSSSSSSAQEALRSTLRGGAKHEGQDEDEDTQHVGNNEHDGEVANMQCMLANLLIDACADDETDDEGRD